MTDKAIREGFHTITPYLVAQDADGLVEFVKRAFGATETSRSIGSSGGLHAELRIGDSMLMIGGGTAGGTWQGEPMHTMLYLYMVDVDSVYKRALAAGATSIAEPADQPYGERQAAVRDAFGNEWYIGAASSSSAPLDDEAEVRALYRRLHDGWNARDADAFAAQFAEDGHAIGFDGSEMAGRAEIAATLRQIFADHETATYVATVRDVRFLAPNVAHLRAVAGLVPPGRAEINPQVNAIQTLVAVKRDGAWRIASFQNTPAQYHGRPELAEALTAELQGVLAQNRGG